MDKVPQKKKEEEEEEEKFSFQFCSNGTRYNLSVPVRSPLDSQRSRELACRVVQAHNLPCYLEDDLCTRLQQFSRDSALQRWDREADEAVQLAGDSVAEGGSKVSKRIESLVEQYTNHCAEFSVATVTQGDGPTFSDMYHSLIHSPSLDTLLQLEHTYSLAMANSLQAWKNARENMAKRHEKELKDKMAAVSTSQATETELAGLMREHERDKTVLEVQWRGELVGLRDTQRKTYHQWIEDAYKEMMLPDSAKISQISQNKRGRGDIGVEDVFSGDEVDEELSHSSTLEESFTIHLGAQLKSTHNIRLICCHPLSLCHQRKKGGGGGGGAMANPERIQTAMSLYSTKLTSLVLMIDGLHSHDGDIEQKFGDICNQSTDFHFPDYSDQIATVMDTLSSVSANRARGGLQLESSSSSHTSETSTPRGGSPFHPGQPAIGLVESCDSSHLSPPSQATPISTTPTSRRSPVGGSVSSAEQDTLQAVAMEPGDFFITRHSNLSQVHVVLHLVTNREAVKDPGLRARNSVMMGLKNCLHVAARNDVHHISVPLLLVHNMTPEMTIQWCLKRSELVFKCVKGFMLENPLWGNGDSRTIQFLIPQGVSEDLFEEICDMVPKVFRVSTARKLSSRPRTHSYK